MVNWAQERSRGAAGQPKKRRKELQGGCQRVLDKFREAGLNSQGSGKEREGRGTE